MRTIQDVGMPRNLREVTIYFTWHFFSHYFVGFIFNHFFSTNASDFKCTWCLRAPGPVL